MKEELPVITLETLRLYKDYAGIGEYDQLETHLIKIRKKLVKEGKINYKCIQRYKFAFSRVYSRFFYKEIIQLAQKLEQNGQKPYFLDIGCCTGTDLRKLLIDGYPKDYLIGMDIEQSYIHCGYELFQDDPATCPIQFIVDDLFTINKTNDLCNTIEIVHTGSVFHLFSDHQIRQFLHRITWLLKPGGLLLGGHVCADQSTQYFRQSTNRLKLYTGIDEFKDILNQEGFIDIKIETDPRLLDQEEEEQTDFITFWISFSAVYRPNK